MYWNLYAKYEDGTIINENRSYNYKEGMTEQQYNFECELLEENSHNFGECIEYSVALMYN